MRDLCFVVICCTWIVTSCVSEKVTGENNDDATRASEGKNISIAVRVPRNSVSTYSVEAGNDDENHIDTLFVRILENDVLKDIRKFYGTDLQLVGSSNDSIVQVAFELDNLGGGIVTAEVFANRMEIAPVSGEIPLPDKNDKTTWFMMSGAAVLTHNGIAYGGTVHMVRDVAKLRVRISKHPNCLPSDLVIDYDQIKVEVLQAPDRTQLMPPPPVSTPAGLTYIANYSSRMGNALRSETPILSFNGGQIDSLYINENYLDNSAYNSTNITRVKITLPSHEPNMPVKTVDYTYDLYTEGGYQLKRNHIYILDIKVAGQSLDPLVTVDVLPWEDVNIIGDIHGAYLTIDPPRVYLLPCHTGNNPATVPYTTDCSSVTLDWSEVNPAHHIDASVSFIQGSEGDIRIFWMGQGAPDYSFVDTMYVIAGNIAKAVILEYNVPSGNFGNWVGTFHRWNQTGERIIKMRNTGQWTATVMQGADFIRLNGENTTDTGWGTSSAALGNDVGFDANYPVSGAATSISGTGVIYFRVGMAGPLAYVGAQPRYGLIEVTGDEGVKKIYVRQGEEADYVMRRDDPNPADAGDPRQYAVRFSPFNLTDPLRGTGGDDISFHNDISFGGAFDSRMFTDYPTQAGYFFQWNTGVGGVLKAYSPVNSIQAVSGWVTASKASWERLLEPCPPGYRHPSDSLRSPLTSEIRQSWYATPNSDTYGPAHPAGIVLDNSVWGYYADGFFDRLTVGTSPNAVDSTTVGYDSSDLAEPGNAEVAYSGRLIYNPVTYASLFLPASGVRADANGALTSAGDMGGYWTNSPNGNNGWAFYFTPTSFYGYNNAHQSNGISVRCVKNEFGLPGSY